MSTLRDQFKVRSRVKLENKESKDRTSEGRRKRVNLPAGVLLHSHFGNFPSTPALSSQSICSILKNSSMSLVKLIR